jgi:hypothetical protein
LDALSEGRGHGLGDLIATDGVSRGQIQLAAQKVDAQV